MKTSFQQSAPGSFFSPEPMCPFACQMQKAAPVGSSRTAIRPTSITSNGSFKTVAPFSTAFFAAASASSTVMYEAQLGGTIAAISLPISKRPATWCSPSFAIE